MNLLTWASQVGVSKYAAYRWRHARTLAVPARGAGRLILVDLGEPSGDRGRAVVCARVWSADHRADLDRRVAWPTSWVAGRGRLVGEVVTEAGSAMNGRRRKLGRVLAGPGATQLAGVGHRGRLARLGACRPLSPPRADGSRSSAPASGTTTWSGT